MSKRIFTLLAFNILLLLAACGTKGDLYIPEQRYPQQEVKNLATHTGLLKSEHQKL